MWKFKKVRKVSPALNSLLVPNDLWPQFKKFCFEGPNEAYHQSILFLAFERGCLNKITSAVQKFLFENNTLKNELSSQYKKSLQEKWMIKESVLERHQKARQYLGKLMEFLIADWLEKQNWKIIDLEALGASSDIIAESPEKVKQAIEQKYIGQKDEVFESVLKSLSGSKGGGGRISSYDLIDYILFRIYEAGKQLKEQNLIKTVLIVVSNTWWSFVDTQISEDWINWKSPSFFLKTSEIKSFVNDQKKKYPQIDTDLVPTIFSLTNIFFIKEDDEFEFKMEKHVKL